MAFSYSCLRTHAKVTLPCVEGPPVIARDPPKSVHTRRIDKVGDTMSIVGEIDASGDRFGESIQKFARGVNPHAQVNYTSSAGVMAGKWMPSSGSTVAGAGAKLPRRIMDYEGAFRPPMRTLEQEMPLSRQPRRRTKMFTNPEVMCAVQQLGSWTNAASLKPFINARTANACGAVSTNKKFTLVEQYTSADTPTSAFINPDVLSYSRNGTHTQDIEAPHEAPGVAVSAFVNARMLGARPESAPRYAVETASQQQPGTVRTAMDENYLSASARPTVRASIQQAQDGPQTAGFATRQSLLATASAPVCGIVDTPYVPETQPRLASRVQAYSNAQRTDAIHAPALDMQGFQAAKFLKHAPPVSAHTARVSGQPAVEGVRREAMYLRPTRAKLDPTDVRANVVDSVLDAGLGGAGAGGDGNPGQFTRYLREQLPVSVSNYLKPLGARTGEATDFAYVRNKVLDAPLAARNVEARKAEARDGPQVVKPAIRFKDAPNAHAQTTTVTSRDGSAMAVPTVGVAVNTDRTLRGSVRACPYASSGMGDDLAATNRQAFLKPSTDRGGSAHDSVGFVPTFAS